MRLLYNVRVEETEGQKDMCLLLAHELSQREFHMHTFFLGTVHHLFARVTVWFEIEAA